MEANQFYIFNDGDIEESHWFFSVWTGSAWEVPSESGYETREEATIAAGAYVASV